MPSLPDSLNYFNNNQTNIKWPLKEDKKESEWRPGLPLDAFYPINEDATMENSIINSSDVNISKHPTGIIIYVADCSHY